MTIEPIVGQIYRIKLRGGRGRADARFIGVREIHWRHNGRVSRSYRFVNLATQREVEVKTKAMIIGQPGLGQQ